MGLKPLCIWFDKIDGFIKIYDGIRYSVLLSHSWYDKICDRIKQVKKVVLQKMLIIMLQKSELIHMIICL